MTKSAMQTELNHFFQTLDNSLLPLQKVTHVALCKARKKLLPSAFIDLNERVVDQFYKQTSTVTNPWFGFRLLAVDGTKYHLPNSSEIRDKYGVSFNQFGHKIAMAMGSVLYDVRQKIVLDAQLYPYGSDEREAAYDHLAMTHEDDLILYDRGYPSYWLAAAHRACSRFWCMRVSVSFNNEVKAFVESGAIQKEILFQGNEKALKKCHEKGLSCEPIAVRLVRVKTKKGIYVLMTNLLDTKRYPAKSFGDLYHARWSIEEGYKRQKSWLEIENFSGKSVNSVKQDFHAKILSLNLTSMTTFAAQLMFSTGNKRRGDYQINFAQALSTMKHTLVRCIMNRLSFKDWQELLKTLSKATSIIRPNRSFERKKRGSSRLKFKPNYKRSA